MSYKFLQNSVLNFDTINIDDVSNVTLTTDKNSLNVTPTLNVSFYDRKKIINFHSFLIVLLAKIESFHHNSKI